MHLKDPAYHVTAYRPIYLYGAQLPSGESERRAKTFDLAVNRRRRQGLPVKLSALSV
jgi:hypothetical protein